MITIALDGMGADNAPEPEIAGSLRAVRELGVKVFLVGREEILAPALKAAGAGGDAGVEIVHAAEQITMEDSAAKAVRTKRDSSIRVACQLVREGRAGGVVSAGNTGAVMATSKMVQGVVPGVERPALASVFPTKTGKPVVVVDVGANVDSSAKMLGQFAIMGSAYARQVLKVANPRVGLLSIGEEEHKGNELTKDATPVLKTLPIEFIGNVEGRDLFSGTADVIVCDGFVGNVALKVSEGLVEAVTGMLKEGLTQGPIRSLGAMLSRGAFRDLKRKLDYTEYGGAPLLGVRGICTICHGRSNANAIRNAIRVTAEYARMDVNRVIETELAQLQGVA
jgi:glycerol-3-phosphate acyltransferase PlsX